MVDERRAFIVSDYRHYESPTLREQNWNLPETDFRLCWMRLCSSDNHYPTAPVFSILLHYESVWNIFIRKISTVWPSLVLKLNVLLEIFVNVYFIFTLTLMTSHECVFVSVVFLYFFISMVDRWKQVNQNMPFGWKKNHKYLVRGDTHTRFVTQNVFGSIYLPTPETVRCEQIFLCCKTAYIGTIGNGATARDLTTISW